MSIAAWLAILFTVALVVFGILATLAYRKDEKKQMWIYIVLAVIMLVLLILS